MTKINYHQYAYVSGLHLARRKKIHILLKRIVILKSLQVREIKPKAIRRFGKPKRLFC